MARGKLILICQSGGEFVTNDDGSLSYAGGEANAVNVNHETLFDDLKLKLAEMCDLEYTTMSIKYFLPGNRRNLITLRNDKDLKRMFDFHGKSVTTDVFVMGRKGFDRDALNMHASRETGIKLAETVNRVVLPTPALCSSPVNASNPVGSIIASPVTTTRATRGSIKRTAARTDATPSATPTDSVMDVDATAESPPAASTPSSEYAADCDSDCAPTSTVAAGPIPWSQTEVDMSATPADTVKKRRRTASWKIGANGPTIVAVTDDSEERRSRKKSSRSLSMVAVADGMEQKQETVSRKDDSDIHARDRRSRRKSSQSLSMVAMADDVEQKQETVSRKDDFDRHVGGKRSRKRSSQCLSMVAVADDMEQKRDPVSRKDVFDRPSTITISDDVSLEKLVASWRDGITGVGQEFKSVADFRDALQKYAIAHRFVYKLKKNETNRASGLCVAEGCSWRIHASWVPAAQSFQIKMLNNLHTCGGESWKSAHPTKNWLVSIIKDRLRDSPHQKPKEIANGIFRDFGLELNYTQVWRAIEDAREQLQGSYKEAYNQLPRLCEKIVETNPGSFTKLITNDDKRFQCLFVSFHASICGFHNGCRPLLFLEATSLKSKYQEILLTATAVDGNDGFFPVAFAIVDVENDDNWHWFLEQLKSTMSTSQSITFVSDREKNLKKSVLEIFENAHYGYSMYHLMESFQKNLKGPFHGDGKGCLPGNFLSAAYAVRLGGFKKYTEKIKQISSQAYDWVMQLESEHWTSLLFKGERYNHITQNVAESYTRLMEEVWELPIIKKIEALISMMSDLINHCQIDSSKWSAKLTPLKEKKVEEETLKARGLKVLFSSDTLFEVHDDATHVVNIDKWECSCLGWKETGLPCHHAIAVFKCTGKSPYDYCSRYFTVDSFRLTYSKSINRDLGVGKPVEKEKADSFDKLVGIEKEREEADAIDKPLEKEKENEDADADAIDKPMGKGKEKENEEADVIDEPVEKEKEKEEGDAIDEPVEKEKDADPIVKPVEKEEGADPVEKPVEEANAIDELVEKEEADPIEKPVEESCAIDEPMGKEKEESVPIEKPVEESDAIDEPVEKEKEEADYIVKPVEKEQADSTVLVLPPCPSRPPPQERRERTETEGAMKRTVTCTRCKEAGHNKSTCKATL